MKKLVCCMVGTMAGVALLGLASSPAGVGAEEPDPQPGLDNVTVRLCIESPFDLDRRYCGPGEILAQQTSTERTYELYGGGQTTLPGTFQFLSSDLNQGGGAPRAVVFGPISGTYEGYTAAFLWGVLFRDGILGGNYHLTGYSTEIFQTTLGPVGNGLDGSYTGEFNLEYGFQPWVRFGTFPYYVALYLDESLPGMLPPPALPPLSTIDGQVWGWSSAPQ